MSLTSEKPKDLQTPTTHFLTIADTNGTVVLKKGDFLNLTLQDFGDGGYAWTVTKIDSKLLFQTEQSTWGSSGMLGDFGKDTWIFSAIGIGSTTLNLECARPFGDHEVCQQFSIHVDIV